MEFGASCAGDRVPAALNKERLPRSERRAACALVDATVACRNFPRTKQSPAGQAQVGILLGIPKRSITFPPSRVSLEKAQAKYPTGYYPPWLAVRVLQSFQRISCPAPFNFYSASLNPVNNFILALRRSMFSLLRTTSSNSPIVRRVQKKYSQRTLYQHSHISDP